MRRDPQNQFDLLFSVCCLFWAHCSQSCVALRLAADPPTAPHLPALQIANKTGSMQDLARWCWSQRAADRPSFVQIAKYLFLLLEEEDARRPAPSFRAAA